MKKILILLALVWLMPTPLAQAVTLVDVIHFPNPTVVTDLHSGTRIDFVYEHVLEELDTAGLKLISAALAITHVGNLNDEPVREAWALRSASGVLIGQLSESSSDQVEDSFQLNESILAEIEGENLWKLGVGLSELTSFNNERIELLESRLTLHYERTPETPEPSSRLMMIGGLLGLVAQMIRGSFKNGPSPV